jgi:CRISPR-associated protein Cmr2
MGNKKYVGITIGPIFKTILNARATGQIWGASYIFSYIMKNFLEAISDENICDKLLVPYFDKNSDIEGVGVYPDRAIFLAKNKEHLKLSLDKVIENVMFNLAKNIGNEFSKEKSNIDKVEEFIKNYFQIYYVIREDVKNPIMNINKALDSLELNNKIMPKVSFNYLMEFLENENIKKSFLAKDAGIINKNFRSVTEISKNNEDDKDDKKSNNYYAIVQSDGDNVGSFIKDLAENEINDFSKKMFEYSKESIEAIKKFNGFPIYAGGDDLLFFAPLKNNDMSIFDLTNQISEIFENKFENKNLTLSFGVAITYHKFPMYEGLKIAQSLLFEDSKKLKTNKFNKNAISVEFIKHSGQTAKMMLNKNSKTYEEFIKLINTKDLNEKNVKSIKNKFRTHNEIIDVMLKENMKIDEYFNNTLKKEFHDKNREYIQTIVDFVNEYNIEYDMKIENVNNILEIKDFFI